MITLGWLSHKINKFKVSIYLRVWQQYKKNYYASSYPCLGTESSWCNALRSFKCQKVWFLWNQCLVNLSFDDNKTRFRTNDYISSVIRQDNFQSDNHKEKSNQGEIMKKKTTSKRSVFQDSSFIRSLCKVVDALGFSCITFFTYAPKSSKSYFIFNFLKLDDFIFSIKTLYQMFSKLV